MKTLLTPLALLLTLLTPLLIVSLNLAFLTASLAKKIDSLFENEVSGNRTV